MTISTKALTRSAIILALAIAIQLAKLPQPFTGPAINALLFIAAALVGPMGAVLIGLCTPIVAFAFGIMPFVPAVFIIMLGNATLVIVFSVLEKRRVLAFLAAAICKFAIMALLIQYIIPGLLQIKIPAKVAGALTIPQLWTALAGAVVAFIILKGIERYYKK